MYYYHKCWWDGDPTNKNAEVLDEQAAKPTYRPKQWVRFVDHELCPEIGELVGKVVFAVKENQRTRYEIQHGFTRHRVSESAIKGRMVDKEDG